jgi:hypothetical protein
VVLLMVTEDLIMITPVAADRAVGTLQHVLRHSRRDPPRTHHAEGGDDGDVTTMARVIINGDRRTPRGVSYK